MLQYFGDIGGLFDFFRYFFGLFIPIFAHTRMNAIFASHLYIWPTHEQEEEISSAADHIENKI